MSYCFVNGWMPFFRICDCFFATQFPIQIKLQLHGSLRRPHHPSEYWDVSSWKVNIQAHVLCFTLCLELLITSELKIKAANEWRAAQWFSSSHASQDCAQVPALKGGGSPQKRYQRRERKRSQWRSHRNCSSACLSSLYVKRHWLTSHLQVLWYLNVPYLWDFKAKHRTVMKVSFAQLAEVPLSGTIQSKQSKAISQLLPLNSVDHSPLCHFSHANKENFTIKFKHLIFLNCFLQANLHLNFTVLLGGDGAQL